MLANRLYAVRRRKNALILSKRTRGFDLGESNGELASRRVASLPPGESDGFTVVLNVDANAEFETPLADIAGSRITERRKGYVRRGGRSVWVLAHACVRCFH